MREWTSRLTEHGVVVQNLVTVLASQLDPAVTMLSIALAEGHRVLLCGNGQSMAAAQGIACQLIGRFNLDRRAFPALVLGADSVALTAIATDRGTSRIFARQVEAYGESGDVLLALSTAAHPTSVQEAILVAKHRGMPTLGVSGREGLNCDVDICIPSTNTARVQELTVLVGHLLIEGLEGVLPP